MKLIIVISLFLSLCWIGCNEVSEVDMPSQPTADTHMGAGMGMTVDINELPAAIQNYIHIHYPEQNIEAIFFNEHPPYNGHNGGEGNGQHRPPNHNGYTYDNNDGEHGCDDDEYDDDEYDSNDCHNTPPPIGSYDGGIYQVILSDGTTLFFDEGGNLVYIEDTQGEWWEQDQDHDELPIALSDLPDTIITYIETNYPDRFIVKAEWQPNGNYEVRLNGGIKLYFDENGGILNLENEFNLRISSLSFPDSVSIGQTVIMTGYIVNQSLYAFSGNTLRISLAIEDEIPTSLTALPPDAQPFDTDLSIAPSDSIPFTFPINIESALFMPGFDIAVVWPDVPTSINPIFTNNHIESRSVFVLP